jgi:hypothetical protein
MNIDPEIAQARPAVLLASIVHLLSCSALHGLSPAKSQSLTQHLAALSVAGNVDPLLRRVCGELMEMWQHEAVASSRQALFDTADAADSAALH